MPTKIFKKSLSFSIFMGGCATFLVGAIGLFMTAIPSIQKSFWDYLIVFGLLTVGIVLIGIGHYYLFPKDD